MASDAGTGIALERSQLRPSKTKLCMEELLLLALALAGRADPPTERSHRVRTAS